MATTGRPKKIRPEHHLILREIVTAHPLTSTAETSSAFTRRTGTQVHRNTLTDGPAEAGIKRVRQPGMTADKNAEVEPDRTDRYGYEKGHRERGADNRYASSLTDAEWALVADIFEVGGRGKPAVFPRLLRVDACCYVLRTGCA